MVRTRVAAILMVVFGLSGLAATPIASADPQFPVIPLPNGLSVRCQGYTDTPTDCALTGCPRVGGDYVPDTVHIMRYGNQEERSWGCGGGNEVTFDQGQPATFSVQVCRNHGLLRTDDCGPWADYTFNPPPHPAPPPPPPVNPGAPSKTAFVTTPPEYSTVDVYDAPGGGGTIIGTVAKDKGIQVNADCKPDDWCLIRGVAVPKGQGWIWGHLRFE
jgi:hypothetical protein